jgi:ubiquitin C-terminal hydrolase
MFLYFNILNIFKNIKICLYIMLAMSKEKNFDKYKNLGLTGLANLGNTCFINSTVQCISHIYELNNFLDCKTYQKRINKIPESLLLIEWDKLRTLMWSENCIIKPAGFINAIQKVAHLKDKDIFTGYAQNDLTEFMNFLFMSFHESIKREVEMNIKGDVKNKTDKLATKCYEMMKQMYKNEYSEFLKMFYGICVSEINSLESSYENIIPEPFFNIDVPIDKYDTLNECLEQYTEKEILDDDNKILNDKTNKREKASKRIMFWSLPNVLIITLKRFSNNNDKNNKKISFPLTKLDMSKYVIGYDKNSYKYDLFGICNHSGGVHGGHYTAYVKNANNNWYHFNDTNVSKIKITDLQTSSAYCFFYRKR